MPRLALGVFVVIWFLAIPIGLVFVLLGYLWIGVGFFLLPAVVRILVAVSDLVNRFAKPS